MAARLPIAHRSTYCSVGRIRNRSEIGFAKKREDYSVIFVRTVPTYLLPHLFTFCFPLLRMGGRAVNRIFANAFDRLLSELDRSPNLIRLGEREIQVAEIFMKYMEVGTHPILGSAASDRPKAAIKEAEKPTLSLVVVASNYGSVLVNLHLQ